MLLFILLLHSLHSQLLSSGAPVIPNPDTGVSLAEETPQFNTNYRSTIEIVWTCASVIFASTWVCVHPNVPGYKRGWKERWGLRGRHFVNALLWPDQAVCNAFIQWTGARALYAHMLEKREALDSNAIGLAERVEGELKCLGKAMRALTEGVERLREDVQNMEGAKRIIDETSRLDADWRKLRSLLAGLTDQAPSREGGVDPSVAQSADSVGVKGVIPRSVEESEKRPLQVGFMGMEDPGDTVKQGSPRDDYWTIVHAHFIQMGGVVFEGVNGAVWYKYFGNWTSDEIKAFFALKLTKEDIQDRSKADALSKAFVIVQCLWFVTQCIGRRASNLPLTELEVTCLAYIACNVGMYTFWWDKPLNVACPVVVSTMETPPKPEDPSTNVSAWDWFVATIGGLLRGDIGNMISPSRGHDAAIPDSLTERYPVNHFYGTFSNLTQYLANLAPLAVFGALHTIAWYAEFPSAIEQLLWRGASVTPAILALVTVVVLSLAGRLHGRRSTTFFNFLFLVTMPISLVACFAARLAFLVLPALQLRSLPPLAYQTISWSDFLPHV